MDIAGHRSKKTRDALDANRNGIVAEITKYWLGGFINTTVPGQGEGLC